MKSRRNSKQAQQPQNDEEKSLLGSHSPAPMDSQIEAGLPTQPGPSARPSVQFQQQFQQQLRRQSKQPTRTTKNTQKLVVFPDQQDLDVKVTDAASDYGGDSLQLGDDLYEKIIEYPYSIAKEKEAERLKKVDRKDLPRVTAYCTAKSYNMDALFAFLLSKVEVNGTNPQRIDECIYTPYTPPLTIFHFTPEQGFSSKVGKYLSSSGAKSKRPVYPLVQLDPVQRTKLGGIVEEDVQMGSQSDLLQTPPEQQQPEIKNSSGEIFFFDYGVTVFWGLSEAQEYYLLSFLEQIEEEKLQPDEIETEAFHYQYRALSQPRIFNDVITLKKLSDDTAGSDYMLKLTISHAIAQSTKLTLFEGKIDDTINTTQHIPLVMAKTGKVHMSRSAIIKKIGHLFVMRINVNLVSPILDTPEIFWSEPSYEPLYNAVRGYLEISQRVELLNQRCAVVSDLLDMLKEHLNSAHGETLEWIIIVLIAIEILIGLVTIFFDFFSLYGNKPNE